MHLFLKGPRGIGKSTLLQQLLRPCQDRLAGFSVQRLYRGGAQVGFRGVLLRGELPPLEAEYKSGMEGVFILDGQKDASVLERVIRQVEENQRNPGCGMILLDEIGGVELASTQFMSVLLQILSGDKPCIGVLKSHENLQHTARHLQLEEGYLEARSALEEAIQAEGQILDMGRVSVEACAQEIKLCLKDVL